MFLNVFHRHAGVFQILTFIPFSRTKFDILGMHWATLALNKHEHQRRFSLLRQLKVNELMEKVCGWIFFYILRGLSPSLRNAKGGRNIFRPWLREEKIRRGVFSLAILYPRYFEERNSFYLNSQLWIKFLGRQEAKFCSPSPPNIHSVSGTQLCS